VETPVLPSLPQRVLSVIVSPGKLFERLAARPVWAGALILGAVLALIASALAPAELFEATMRRQIQNRGGQVPDNLEQAVTIARIAGSLGALIMGPLFTAAIAGLVSLIFLFVLGDAGTYRQHLSMLAHAFLIPGIGNLAMLPLRIQAQDLQLRLSVGTFFPFLQDGWLASALSWLDLFGIWAWVLVALGASKIDPKRSWTSATVIILSLVLVVTFGLAAIFGR
jgi:hypothetical protein